MITDLFWPKLNDMDVEGMWLTQDGATCHTADATMDILHEGFQGMVISRRGDELATKIVRFDPARLFLWGFPEVAGLCQ